uniref:Uncharacterized protein n=1 Tax=Picea glauca TaxID=3330 RepID=A0A101M0N0_PICGL|nr:hypothetical protein ABT39_MTgene4177 [Picea glauca]QHR91131.1 hypothetical protein Q903MT_gene5163 [Picea sitchensis]
MLFFLCLWIGREDQNYNSHSMASGSIANASFPTSFCLLVSLIKVVSLVCSRIPSLGSLTRRMTELSVIHWKGARWLSIAIGPHLRPAASCDLPNSPCFFSGFH